MPQTLLIRAGEDTLGKLEAAATRRYAEARRLEVTEPLGAVYLYGYTVEMRLKAAYYRVAGLVPASQLNAARKIAEATIKGSPPTVPKTTIAGRFVSAGHNVRGWAWLLETTRATPPNIPMSAALAREMQANAQVSFDLWSETLRYRANRPRPTELAAINVSAAWFRRNAKNLWS
jgi:hypothetical protein